MHFIALEMVKVFHMFWIQRSLSKEIDSLSVQSFCLQGQIFQLVLKVDIIIKKKKKKTSKKIMP